MSFTTPGGEVDAGLRLYDELRKIAQGVQLSTHAFGLVASMGVAVYLAGDKRSIGPHARLMLHATSNRFEAGQQLTAAQLRQLAEQMDGRDGREREIVVERTGLTEDEARALVDGGGQGDTWLAANDAVEKGFSSEIDELRFVAGSWYSELGPYAQPETS